MSSSSGIDRKSTRLNSSHTVIYTLSLHDALPIYPALEVERERLVARAGSVVLDHAALGDDLHVLVERDRSEEHTSELQSHRDLHSFPTRRSSDLSRPRGRTRTPRRACRQRRT